MLLAVTNHLTQNIASFPFLWVVPLSIYLLTFILTFDHPRWYVRPVFFVLLAGLLPAMAWKVDSLDLWIAAPLYAGGLFVAVMFCHGELARLRPSPKHLTSFYLMLSVGGAFGSVLIGLVAPNVLDGYYELGFVLLGIAALGVLRLWPTSPWLSIAPALVLIGTGWIVWRGMETYGLQTVKMVRNFYGVVRIVDFTSPEPYRAMYHGGIMHGGEVRVPGGAHMPSSYFGVTSGYGRLFRSLPGGPHRVGVIGLGAGAVAAWSRPGDTFRFYEIDPHVIDAARDDFNFLSESLATVEIVLGDGRLALEREADQGYDILAMDAFSGDAIPMHLLTRESFATYVRHIKQDGAIIFQATNRFVDIAPVVERLASEHGMTSVLISDSPGRLPGIDYWRSATDQIICTRNRTLLVAEPIASVSEPLLPRPEIDAWTDDASNLLRILK